MQTGFTRWNAIGGSWNDLGFDGSKQKEYESVSESLFSVINEAILTAANSGYRK